MSETVRYTGTLTKVTLLPGETLEEQCQRLMYTKQPNSTCMSYVDQLLDCMYNIYTVQEGVLYLIEKHQIPVETETFKAQETRDGDINFEVAYYNGGCCLTDALTEAIRNMREGDEI